MPIRMTVIIEFINLISYRLKIEYTAVDFFYLIVMLHVPLKEKKILWEK